VVYERRRKEQQSKPETVSIQVECQHQIGKLDVKRFGNTGATRFSGSDGFADRGARAFTPTGVLILSALGRWKVVVISGLY
jgi:hypothetical protein